MRKLLALVAVVGLVSTAACKKKEEKAETPATEAPKVEVPVVEVPVVDAPAMANKMEHCPSSVEGATTKVEDGEGVVIVTVTGADEAATAEIRIRATYLAGLNDADGTEVKHSGEGTGGGALGKCPVVLGHAKLVAEDVEGGSKVTMTPTKEGGAAELSKLANDRVAALATGATTHDDHGTGMHPGEHAGDGEPAKHGGHGGGTGGGGGGGGGADKAPTKAKAGIDAGA